MHPFRHHHHHQYTGTSAHSSSNNNVVANHHHHQHHNMHGVNRGNNNHNNGNNVVSRHQQLADRANFLIHKQVDGSPNYIGIDALEHLYKQSQDKAEATIKYYLQEHALPFLKMFLDCYNEYVKLGQFQGRGFFDAFSSIIDNRLAVMNNQQSGEYEQYQTILANYYNNNKMKLRNTQDSSGLLVALGRACFILEHSLRWKSTQLYVLPVNVLESLLDNATSFVEQELSSKRGENAFYEEKYGSVTSDDRQQIEKVILQKQKRSHSEDPNVDVIKEMFTLVCTNKTIPLFQPFTLPIHFAGYFVRIVNNVFHFIDPMPLRMYYIETTCITFDEQYHRVQVDPHKSIPQFSFHDDAHLHQSTFNLVDGLFLLIESATSRSSPGFIYLSSCFNALMTFARYCAAPLVSKNLLQVTDDARNYHDPLSSSSSSSSSASSNNNNNTNIVNNKKVPTKNRLFQLAHYLEYFVSRSADGSCSKAAKQLFEVLNLLVWKCSMGVFRNQIDVESLFSIGFPSREIAAPAAAGPSIRNFFYSFNEVIDRVCFDVDTNPLLKSQFRDCCLRLETKVKNGRNAMILKKALSSANGEIDAVEEAFFQDLRDNFDADFARASSSSQNANNADHATSNNNNHPAPPAPLPPSDDDPLINRITPASPPSQQPQRNLPAPVTLPAVTVAPPPRPRISGLEMLTQLYLEHIAKCGSIEFATSNHHMVVFETLINNNPNITIVPRYEDLSKNETISNETKAEHLLRDGAVATILRRYPLMSFNEQNFFNEILRDCDRSHTAHRNKIDPDFDKKCYRDYLKHDPECSSRANYNYFETTPPSILKQVSSCNNNNNKKNNNKNNKRCRWNDDSVDDFPLDATKIAIPFVETDIAFGRWISQRCTAPRLDHKYSASNPGAVFYHHLTVGFAHKETKNKKDGSEENNNKNKNKNNDNAASAHQQYYGSSRLGGHHVNNNNTNNKNKNKHNNNNQTNELMSGQRRERDNNNNQTNKIKN